MEEELMVMVAMLIEKQERDIAIEKLALIRGYLILK
jgi:hypothetical protein